MTAPSSAHRLGKAVLLGLCLGFYSGAGVLGYEAFRAHQTPCENFTPQECELKLQLAKTHARTQALTAVALVFLASACALLLRPKKNTEKVP